MTRPLATKVEEAKKRPLRRKQNFLTGPLKRKSRLEASSFEERATALATALGWQGDWDAELFGVTVKDARAYLQGKLHQVHVDVCNSKEPPSATELCRHLGLHSHAESFEESVRLVQEQIDFVVALDLN